MDTLVAPEHRGHRLGLLMKLATLDRLHDMQCSRVDAVATTTTRPKGHLSSWAGPLALLRPALPALTAVEGGTWPTRR